MKYSELVYKSIGKTPLVELNEKLSGGANVFAKCEFLNPSGSHKDRLYKHAIDKLEREGSIRPGMTLIDFSSGNAGAALAFVGALKGYNVIIIRPSGLSRGKAVQIISYGAEIVFTPLSLGVPGAREKALRISKKLGDGGYLMYQTDSHLNPDAYYSCGTEIVRFFERVGRSIDAFVCGVGTGGTLTGVGKALKKRYPQVSIIAVEIAESAVLFHRSIGQTFLPRKHHLEGLSTGEIYSNLDTELIDRVVTCSEREAIAHQKEIMRCAKMLVGPTSGASLFGARETASSLGKNANIVTIFWDSGWKYFGETSLPTNVERELSTTRFL